MEILTGDTIDISEQMKFEFYNLCWYWDNQNDKIEINIGIWIGFSHRVGSALCYWVFIEKVNIIVLTNVQNVTRYESENTET